MNDALLAAYRFHRRNLLSVATQCPRHRSKTLDSVGYGAMALTLARADVANAKPRYGSSYWVKPFKPATPQADGMTWVQDPSAIGLRLVGRVAAECGGRNGYWSETGGWFTDPFGDVFDDDSGLCYGLVYQFPGRNGKACFIAGYEFGGTDGGPTLDLSKLFIERGDYGYPAQDMDAARDAARVADRMARIAAESEREYQSAWQAGSRWAEKQNEKQEARADLMAILAERRKVKGQGNYPALCGAIRARVSDLLSDIAKARDTMATLADGDDSRLGFWSGDKRLQGAFCEGAGLSTFPA